MIIILLALLEKSRRVFVQCDRFVLAIVLIVEKGDDDSDKF